jgi:outer membrane protein assembly factor BamB
MLIALAIASIAVRAWARPLLGPEQMMPTSEIRAGMIATGKTVFHGTDIETFHLEILGVAHKIRNGGDVILARITDGTLIERQSSVLQGMSGSPVYIGDRLIGAIAFSWPFAKEPVCGITPIADMLKVLEALAAPAEANPPAGIEPPQPGRPAPAPAPPPPAEPKPRGEPTAAPDGEPAAHLAQPLTIAGHSISKVRIADGPATGPAADAPDAMTLRPMGGLLLVSGVSPRGLGRMRELLEPFGIAVTEGIGGSADFPGGDLQPGAGLAIQLIRGDFDATAIGTVTAVIGDRVLGFGHPMTSLGEIDLPLSTAYIQAIFPSYATSMKMGVAGKVVGRISQDRPWAVAGVTGQSPDGVPMSVTVSDATRGTTQRYNAEVVRNKLLTPGLAAAVALSAVDRAWERIGEGTAEVSVEIEGAQRTIKRSDVTFSGDDVAADVVEDVIGPLAGLMENEFGAVQIKAVRLNVRISSEHRTARLERASVEPGKHKAGQPLEVNLLLRPFKGEPVQKTIVLNLPPDLPDGQLRIGVAGGEEAQPLRAALGIMPRRPFSLDQMVDIYETAERGNEVVALAALPWAGVAVSGRRIIALSDSLADSLLAARSSVVIRDRAFVKATLGTEWVIQGRLVITADIEGKPGAAKARPIPPQPSPAPAAPPAAERQEEGPEGDVGMTEVAASSPSGEADEAGAEEAAKTGEGTPQKPKAKEGPVARKPGSLTFAGLPDFLSGELDGIACDQDGALTLAPQAKTVASLDEPVVSAMMTRGDALYVATAPGGHVRKLSLDGHIQQTWDTGAVVVTCLADGPQGAILAGTAPGGRILSLTEDGKAQDYYATGEEAVLALASAPGGGVYAGTDPNGKVFVTDAAGHGRLFCQLPASSVYSLAVAKDVLYAGTGNAGVLYAIDAAGRARAAFDSDQSAVTSLAVGADGAMYAGAAENSAVVQLRANGGAEKIMQVRGKTLASLVGGSAGVLYALTAEDGVVYQLDPVKETSCVLRKPRRAQATALALGANGAIFVAQSNPGAIVALGPERAEKGVFTSKPQAADPGSVWSALSCAVQRPDGATATFQTRSGDDADPGDHWSAWSAPSELGAGAVIASPRATYLQYRISLNAAQSVAAPVARDVQLTYLPPNHAPSVDITAPKPAERLRAKFDAKWKAHDPDDDTLTYDLATSADGGRTWKDIKSGIDETTYSWDTKGLADGSYLLRVIASDRPSNPEGARQDEDQQLIWIDNTPPTTAIMRSSVTESAERHLTLRGAATDSLSPIRGVDYRVDGGKWRAAAVQGLGTQAVTFKIETDALAVGERKIEVRAFDAANNSSQDEADVTVEAGATRTPKVSGPRTEGEVAKPSAAAREEKGKGEASAAGEKTRAAPGESSGQPGAAASAAPAPGGGISGALDKSKALAP